MASITGHLSTSTSSFGSGATSRACRTCRQRNSSTRTSRQSSSAISPFSSSSEGNVGAAACASNVYSLYQVEAAFVRLFRGAGIDCAVHKAKKAIEEAVFALVVKALPAPSDGPEERDELNTIATDAETLAERLNYVGDMGIDDELLAQAQGVLSDLATQASRRGSRGRPKKAPATHAALVVIEMFEEITGFEADSSKPGKPRILEPLVRHAFSVLAIDGKPRAAIPAALRERRSS